MQLKKDKRPMKAIGLDQYLPIDDPSSLMDVALPTPVPGERDLLVRVEVRVLVASR